MAFDKISLFSEYFPPQLEGLASRDQEAEILRRIFNERLRNAIGDAAALFETFDGALQPIIPLMSNILAGNPVSRTVFYPVEYIWEMLLGQEFWQEIHSKKILGNKNAFYESRFQSDVQAILNGGRKMIGVTEKDVVPVVSCPFVRVGNLTVEDLRPHKLEALMAKIKAIDTTDQLLASGIKNLLLWWICTKYRESVFQSCSPELVIA